MAMNYGQYGALEALSCGMHQYPHVLEVEHDYDIKTMSVLLRVKFITGITLYASIPKYFMEDGPALLHHEDKFIKLVTDRIDLHHCPILAQPKTMDVAMFNGHTQKLVLETPDTSQLAMVGGLETGSLRSSASNTLFCAVLGEPETLLPVKATTTTNFETHPYTKEKLAIGGSKGEGTVHVRVWKHSSVPNEQLPEMFMDVLREFPFVRIQAAYAGFFWLAKRMELI